MGFVIGVVGFSCRIFFTSFSVRFFVVLFMIDGLYDCSGGCRPTRRFGRGAEVDDPSTQLPILTSIGVCGSGGPPLVSAYLRVRTTPPSMDRARASVTQSRP